MFLCNNWYVHIQLNVRRSSKTPTTTPTSRNTTIKLSVRRMAENGQNSPTTWRKPLNIHPKTHARVLLETESTTCGESLSTARPWHQNAWWLWTLQNAYKRPGTETITLATRWTDKPIRTSGPFHISQVNKHKNVSWDSGTDYSSNSSVCLVKTIQNWSLTLPYLN